MKKLLALFIVLAVLTGASVADAADAEKEIPFRAVWNAMSPSEKNNFISGAREGMLAMLGEFQPEYPIMYNRLYKGIASMWYTDIIISDFNSVYSRNININPLSLFMAVIRKNNGVLNIEQFFELVEEAAKN